MGALRALRQHGHRQRRRLRGVPGGPAAAAVCRRHDQHPERRASRASQRHRPDHRRLRAACARTAAAAAAAGGRGPSRPLRSAGGGGCRRRSRRACCFSARSGRSAPTCMRRRTATRSLRARRVFRSCCSKRSPPGCAVAALPGEGTSRAGEHWSLAEMAQAETADAYADAIERALAPATPETVARARAMARRHDWSVVVPKIRRVYDEALAAHARATAGKRR